METSIALLLLGIISLAFFSGINTATRAAITSDERATAESLARLQIEYIKGESIAYIYDTDTYTPADIPDNPDYSGYTAAVEVSPLSSPDTGIQRITVTARRNGETIFTLQDYKVDR